MRLLLPLAALLGLAACGPSGGLGSATVQGQPTATTEDGLSLSVLSIAPQGDKTVVEMWVVNGDDRAETLSRRYSPMTLTDETGKELEGPEEAIELAGYSSDRLRVEFAGQLEGARVTLRVGDLTVPDLPTGATTFEAGGFPTVGDLSSAQANHPNGSTLRAMGVTFGETETSVDVEAVNGHEREISLSSSSSNHARLADERGRVYLLVPPQSNPDLDIEQGQSLRGTLRFAGRVTADVQRLTLHINQQHGGDEDYSSDPRFAIELPLTPAE